MDAAQALADLTEISSQIEAAVLFRRDGALSGSTLADGSRAEQLAQGAKELLDAAEAVRPGGAARLTQLEVATPEGSVFLVRDGDTCLAATTGTQPTVGLVFYDLKSCLRSATAEPEQQPDAKPRRSPRAAAATPDAS